MFGYILPDKPELKVKELDIYNAYYCGICRSIKKNVGNIPRFSLTYDFAFLSMLLSSIIEIDITASTNWCVASPIKKKPYVNDNEILRYCAELNVLLFYYKLIDNLKDDKNPIYLPLIIIYRIKINKLLKKYHLKSGIIKKEISGLSEMEKRNEQDLDILSNKFGKIMEVIFSYDEGEEKTKKILSWMGFNLGKWIYVIDAFDDLKQDIKKKRFNPLITKGEGYEETRNKQRERIETYLYNCLEETSSAFELLDIKKNKNLLQNIIYSGLLKKTQERCKEDEKSI